jgi:hypothetical protein
MSYIAMDHAGWVREMIAYNQKRKPMARERQAAAEHRGWWGAPAELNEFQVRAITILGIVGGGIYNAPIAWSGVWWHPEAIGVSWYKGLATFDFSELTTLVFLAHEARIRASIAPCNPKHVEIHLHRRAATGSMSRRHPDLDEAVAAWRALLPVDHPVRYREPEPAAPPRNTEAAA